MATGGRKTQLQVIHEISITLTPAQMNSALPQVLGVIPAGAILDSYHFVTSQAFDGATATVALGYTSGGSQIVGATNVKPVGRTDANVPIGSTGFYLTDTTIYFQPAGGPNTVGVCTLWLEYLPGPG